MPIIEWNKWNLVTNLKRQRKTILGGNSKSRYYILIGNTVVPLLQEFLFKTLKPSVSLPMFPMVCIMQIQSMSQLLSWQWPGMSSRKIDDTFDDIGHVRDMSFLCPRTLSWKSLWPQSHMDICPVPSELEDTI